MLACFDAGLIKPTEKKSPDNGGRGFRPAGGEMFVGGFLTGGRGDVLPDDRGRVGGEFFAIFGVNCL